MKPGKQPSTHVFHKPKASPAYKLLRLRECPQGEALKIIENWGRSAVQVSTRTEVWRETQNASIST